MNKKTNLVLFLCCIATALVFGSTRTTHVNAKSRYVYAKTTVNIRTKPIIKSKIVGKLYEMDKIIALDTIKSWTIIEYNQRICYIKSKYLSKKKPKYITKSSPSNTFKSYMDYRCITAKSSPQYKLQHNKAYTDDRTGIRMVNGRYCIALGSYYVKTVGTKVDLIMKNGKVIKCILADQKADKDTINNHRQHPDGSIIEVLVDTGSLPRKVKRTGDVSYVNPFKGSIKKIRIYKEEQ